jgi:pimeloyl-ACP methyl ester carboxylesterase
LLLSLLAACTSAPKPGMTVLQPPDRPYDFPWIDPLAATVVGTPPILRADLPEQIAIDELALPTFPERRIPEILWWNDKLRFSLVYQQHRAPLIFVVAGTGASHDTRLMRVMQKAFFDAGFHVISLPSPSNPNFIVNASTTGVPGRIVEDARDLYRTMQRTYAQVRDRIEVSDFYLAGYSLGGWQAAFVANLDEKEGAFDFAKVLMINPPVNLYNSMKILDRMLDDTLPGGTEQFNVFINDVFEAFSKVYRQSQSVDFGELVYQAYVKFVPTDTTLQSLIGLAFRLQSNNMAFTADVITDYGYLVPRGTRLATWTSLTRYFDVGMQRSFENYADEFLYPYFKKREPGLTHQELLDEATLVSIEDYLASADKIGLLTNEDDIILADGEIDYLRKLFGPRATIFPTGGHLGNFDDRHFVHAMVGFFHQ